jgi:hypothetical protein
MDKMKPWTDNVDCPTDEHCRRRAALNSLGSRIRHSATQRLNRDAMDLVYRVQSVRTYHPRSVAVSAIASNFTSRLCVGTELNPAITIPAHRII